MLWEDAVVVSVLDPWELVWPEGPLHDAEPDLEGRHGSARSVRQGTRLAFCLVKVTR